MIPAQKPENESERIAALHEYNILDTLPEKEYDDITRIAAEICGMPISTISLIDTDRQWFKSRVGLEDPETDRDLAFCAHAILAPNEIFKVDDPSQDERFQDNPFVIGPPYIGFYAGVPLVNNSGNALGTLCVMDNRPRQLTHEQEVTLRALARQIVAQLETRKKNMELLEQKALLEQLNKDLTRFAHVVAHDMKSPIGSLAMSVTYLRDNYADALDHTGLEFLGMMETTTMNAIEMVNGILNHTQTVTQSEIIKQHVTFGKVVDELRHTIMIPPDFSFHVHNRDLQLYTSKSLLMHILLNLCNNAIKYNDKEKGEITLTAKDTGAAYEFSVKDNGPGIKEEDQTRIFELFTTLGKQDRFNKTGTGIGLSTVKRSVEKLGGTILVKSKVGDGSEFVFTLSK